MIPLHLKDWQHSWGEQRSKLPLQVVTWYQAYARDWNCFHKIPWQLRQVNGRVTWLKS